MQVSNQNAAGSSVYQGKIYYLYPGVQEEI
jgi:YHS domain-containing protein